MRQVLTVSVFGFLFIVFGPVFAKAQEQTIQEQIEAAQSGDTIYLPEGVYVENIVINKPIHIVGTENVTLIQNNASPVITIQSDDVEMEYLNIKQEDPQQESPAIVINGHHNILHKIKIDTNSYGIQLDQANDNTLSHIHISGDEHALMKDRQHGIDIWKSHRNDIHDTTIHDVQDGIYVEKSNETKLYHNNVYQSRYGYHLMFTKNTTLESNESYENISGMMVMGADGTVISDNLLTKNQENIQSLGLLVFDTTNASIKENHITNNRIGIFMEDASNNTLSRNDVKENYIGLQLKGAEKNEINKNSFVANVVQGQAQESATNNTNENYWGDHVGLDMTGDQRSNLAYQVDPFFLTVTNDYPVFQLLFQAPGMIFLEQLIHTPVDQQFVDQYPLMQDPLAASDNLPQHSFIMLSVCMSLLIFSVSIMYLGVKRNEKI